MRSLPIANPDVIFKPLPDGAVLFHAADEVYFGLNPVGARVWELLPPACQSFEQLCGEIAGEFPGAEEQVVRTDVNELLDELSGFDLVRMPPEGEADETTPAEPGS